MALMKLRDSADGPKRLRIYRRFFATGAESVGSTGAG